MVRSTGCMCILWFLVELCCSKKTVQHRFFKQPTRLFVLIRAINNDFDETTSFFLAELSATNNNKLFLSKDWQNSLFTCLVTSNSNIGLIFITLSDVPA
jgi:hypothetical protein